MPTREGVVTLIVTISVFLLATNLMSGLLFVLNAVLVSLLLAGAVTAYLPLRRIRVTRRAPDRGVEGSPVAVEITVTSPRGGRFLTIEDGWAGARVRAFVPHLAAGLPAEVTVHPVAPRRGVHAFRPVEVTSRGLVGLVLARRQFEIGHRIVVWPQVRPVAKLALAHLAPAFEGRAADIRTRQPDDLYGVRDYRPGDSLAHIHWRSSARRGGLVVREFERTAGATVAIIVDLDQRQEPGRLDEAARAAASLLRAALEHQADAVMAGWDQTLAQRQGWEAAMDWLAGVTPSGPPVAEVLASVRDVLGRHLIVVAASARTPADEAGVTVVVPAGEASPRQALVYEPDGTVHAW